MIAKFIGLLLFLLVLAFSKSFAQMGANGSYFGIRQVLPTLLMIGRNFVLVIKITIAIRSTGLNITILN